MTIVLTNRFILADFINIHRYQIIKIFNSMNDKMFQAGYTASLFFAIKHIVFD